MSAISEWLKKNPRQFNFFGNRQYLPKSQYDIEMEKKWRNPWQSYGKEGGKTAPVSADKILRDEAMRRSSAEQFRAQEAARAGMPIPNARTTPEMLTSMQSGLQPMDMTRYYKERDTSFGGAMAKTMASGLAKAAKPKKMTGTMRGVGGGQRVFTPETFDTASWAAPAAPSNYQETLTDPTIETYLRPWRLKHGYTRYARKILR